MCCDLYVSLIGHSNLCTFVPISFSVACVDLCGLLEDHWKSQVCAVCLLGRPYHTYPHFRNQRLNCYQDLHFQSLALSIQKSEV